MCKNSVFRKPQRSTNVDSGYAEVIAAQKDVWRLKYKAIDNNVLL